MLFLQPYKTLVEITPKELGPNEETKAFEEWPSLRNECDIVSDLNDNLDCFS